MKQQLLSLQASLNQQIIGRSDVIKSTLLSLVAGENILLIGPPGTGKSMLARQIAGVLQADDTHSNDYFEYLLTKFSTPEEVFGPLSISELKKDNFKRNVAGYLPTVKVAFLDEIFKASSSILNALLTILNERKYHNGTEVLDVPLQSIISASNELPTGQAELSALYDRFLVRRFVDYLDEQQLDTMFNFTSTAESISADALLSQADLARIQQQAKSVVFPDEVRQAILSIKHKFAETFKEHADEQLSDRRFMKCLHLMRISAVTNERQAVDFSDVLLLKDVLWNVPEHIDTVREIILNELKNYDSIVHIEGGTAKKSTEKTTKTTKTTATIGATIKGFKGSGTPHDPLLIENLSHLKQLERPEVGQQGYYFKQVADIDCNAIDKDSWFNITFKGHYDGNQHTIHYGNAERRLFDAVSESTLQHMHLTGQLGLAIAATNSQIVDCHSGWVLLGKDLYQECDTIKGIEEMIRRANDVYQQSDTGVITGCTLHHCSAGYALADHIRDCEVQYCFANATLIRFNAINSRIKNCEVEVDINKQRYSLFIRLSGAFGAIAQRLKNSHVEACLISEK